MYGEKIDAEGREYKVKLVYSLVFNIRELHFRVMKEANL